MSIFESPFQSKKQNYTKKSLLCKLREIRYEKKLNQEQIAKDLHISKSLISAIENHHKFPSLYTAFLLAEYLETSLDRLFEFEVFPQSGPAELDDFERQMLESLKESQPQIPWEELLQQKNKSHNQRLRN